MLLLVPSAWELRRTARFCINNDLRDCCIALESRDALERPDLRIWCGPTGLFGLSYSTLVTVCSHGSPGGRRSTASPERKRASLPHPERMAQFAPAFGVSPSEKRTLDIITDHPMIPREHLALWLGVSEGRVSQMMRSLVDTWGLVERRGKRGNVRYTLSAEGIRYATHRDRAELPTTRGIWSTALTTDKQCRRRHVGHRIETWARQTKHADGITWFLSKLQAEARADPGNELEWSVPPPGPTGPTTGAIRPSHPTPWGRSSPRALGYPSTSSTSFAPVTPGSPCPPETLHALLPFQRAGGGPAAVPRHPVHRGHKGGRGHLREHQRPI